MMRRNTRSKGDAPSSPLSAQLLRNSLRAEKRACEIDVVRAPPFVGSHFYGVCAAYDAREAV